MLRSWHLRLKWAEEIIFLRIFFFIKNSVFVETRRGGRVEITKKTNNKCQVGIIESHYFVSVLFFFCNMFHIFIHPQAVAARDTLSKALYSHLFDYLVKVRNTYIL